MLLTVVILTIGFTYGLGNGNDDLESMKVLKQVEIGPGGRKYLALRIPIPIERGLSIKVLPRRRDNTVLRDDEVLRDDNLTFQKVLDNGERLFKEMTSGKEESKVFKEGSIESTDLTKNNFYLSDTLQTKKTQDYDDYPSSTSFTKEEPKIDGDYPKQSANELSTRFDYEELMISGVTYSGPQQKYDNQEENIEEMAKYRTSGQMIPNEREPSHVSSPKVWIVPMSWTTGKSGGKMKNQIRGKIKDQNLSNETKLTGNSTRGFNSSKNSLVEISTFVNSKKGKKVENGLATNKTQETGTRAGRQVMKTGESRNTALQDVNAPLISIEEDGSKKKKDFGPIPKKWLEDTVASENPLPKATTPITLFDKHKNNFRPLEGGFYNPPVLSDGLPSSLTETYNGASTVATLSTLSPIETGLVAFSKKINNSFGNRSSLFKNHKGNKTRTNYSETRIET